MLFSSIRFVDGYIKAPPSPRRRISMREIIARKRLRRSNYGTVLSSTKRYQGGVGGLCPQQRPTDCEAFYACSRSGILSTPIGFRVISKVKTFLRDATRARLSASTRTLKAKERDEVIKKLLTVEDRDNPVRPWSTSTC